ncbi:DsbA family protein [Thalassospiraceae bacterium LMO-JJ14]|nr:DsbA family protein [Thalassospiraceae bacterium LMO-JJ14]
MHGLITRFAFTTVFACALLLLVASPVLATSHDTVFSNEETQAIKQIIRDYIMKSPETILRSVQEHQARQESEKEQRVVEIIRDRSEELLNDPNSYVAGNPEGDVTMVEFFDYRCGYCKRVHPVVKKLLQDDGNIRLVYKEFPILGPPSVYAARAAIASLPGEKYLPFHNALMEARGALTEERVLFIAEDVGLDPETVEADIKSGKDRANEIIAMNFDLADALKITGTPAFVIGDTVIRGAVDMSTFVDAIADVRKKQRAKGG